MDEWLSLLPAGRYETRQSQENANLGKQACDTNSGKDKHTCKRACHQRVHDEKLKYVLEKWRERNAMSSAFHGDAKSWTKRVSLLRQNLGLRDATYHGRTPVQNTKKRMVR
jgi:hypothetical protein